MYKSSQIYHAKRTAIYFVSIGIIVSYFTIILMYEVGYLINNVVESNEIQIKLAVGFISMQLILFAWKLFISGNKHIFSFENIAISNLFFLEYMIIWNNWYLSILNFNPVTIINIIEIVKTILLLVYSVISVIEIIDDKNFNYLQINTSE
jgi:hypothetical protein